MVRPPRISITALTDELGADRRGDVVAKPSWHGDLTRPPGLSSRSDSSITVELQGPKSLPRVISKFVASVELDVGSSPAMVELAPAESPEWISLSANSPLRARAVRKAHGGGGKSLQVTVEVEDATEPVEGSRVGDLRPRQGLPMLDRVDVVEDGKVVRSLQLSQLSKEITTESTARWSGSVFLEKSGKVTLRAIVINTAQTITFPIQCENMPVMDYR